VLRMRTIAGLALGLAMLGGPGALCADDAPGDDWGFSGPKIEEIAFDDATADDPALWTDSAGYQRAFDADEWIVLPPGLLYRSYLAGEKESRFQFLSLNEAKRGQIWETALGGRMGVLRHGTYDSVNPQGWQLDIEGAALPRIDPQAKDNLEAVDFRFGVLSTWKQGPNAFKAGYYHLSSHIGDEFLIENPGFVRVNYVRDSAIVGMVRDVTLDTQVYGEFAYAFNANGGAEPLEFQLGTQYSPVCAVGLRGAPFAAVNVHIREEFSYETSVNVVAGWQWRGAVTSHRFRAGMQFYDGPSMQWELLNRHERLFGGGLWADY